MGSVSLPSVHQASLRKTALGLYNCVANKEVKSSKFLSSPQASEVLQNFSPSGTDFIKALNPRSKLLGILSK